MDAVASAYDIGEAIAAAHQHQCHNADGGGAPEGDRTNDEGKAVVEGTFEKFARVSGAGHGLDGGGVLPPAEGDRNELQGNAQGDEGGEVASGGGVTEEGPAKDKEGTGADVDDLAAQFGVYPSPMGDRVHQPQPEQGEGEGDHGGDRVLPEGVGEEGFEEHGELRQGINGG